GLTRAILSIGPVDYGYLWLLLFLAVVTGRTKVRLIGGSSLSLMTSVVLVAMMMLGTSAGILVGICGVIAQCIFPWRKFILHHLIFNVEMIVFTISGAVAGSYYAVPYLHAPALARLLR